MPNVPLVNIIMPTYNHANYISFAIESILMQRCNFNYLIIIGEDNSEDNTREICEKYQKEFPDRILLLNNKINLGLIKNYKRIFEACTAKYIAILESDDFWIDSLKLQKQIDIMENDDSIGLVHTKSSTLYENGEKKTNFHLYQSNSNNEKLFAEIIQGKYSIVPVTVCFRRILLDKIDFDFCQNNDLKTLDAFLWPEFVMHTKIWFIDNITGCYRNLESSVSNTRDLAKIKNFVESSQKIKLYYSMKYPLKGYNKEEILARGNYYLAQEYLHFRNFKDAIPYTANLPFNKIKYLLVKLVSRVKLFYPLFRLQEELIKYLSRTKQFIHQLI